MVVGWRIPGLAGAALMVAVGLATPAAAAPPPTPGMEVDNESERCTAGFAAQGNDGSYYLLTGGHCDAHDGSDWTYGTDDTLLGTVTASEVNGDKRDAAIIRLDPEAGAPNGNVDGRYQVQDVLGASQLRASMPFCKVGAVTGENCGEIKGIEGDVVEASVYSLEGDSGSPGFVKNPDGSVSAVGILMSSPDGDDYTTYFTLVQPLLGQWGLRILP